jgi:hypothetical protein
VTAAVVLQPGLPTGVGSLPYDDANAAAIAELQLHPELPAAPQLPRRSSKESMLAQVSAGMAGVGVRDDGRLTIERRSFGPGDTDAPLDDAAWGGTLAFLTAATGRKGTIKIQLTGPVTLGLALVDAGARAAKAFSVASETVQGRVQALVASARERVPDAPIVLVLDEPSLARAMHPGFPLVPEETVDLISGSLATAASAGAAVHGVHCCGAVDWSLVLHAGPDLVSLPAVPESIDDAAALSVFLDRGGWVAWGIVPTDRPFGDRYETHWHRLVDVWKGLTAGGCDPVRLRTQALLTPACGLAMHDESQVPVVMSLVRRVAERVQDQAYAARMSVGA